MKRLFNFMIHLLNIPTCFDLKWESQPTLRFCNTGARFRYEQSITKGDAVSFTEQSLQLNEIHHYTLMQCIATHFVQCKALRIAR